MPRPLMVWSGLAPVFVGGALGTAARYTVTHTWAPQLGSMASLLIVNVLGAFALGATSALLARDSPAWALLAPGFCGGFTTFSSWMLDVDGRVRRGRIGPAALEVAVSLAAGLLAVRLARRLARGATRRVPGGSA